jgi:hypothetical protein
LEKEKPTPVGDSSHSIFTSANKKNSNKLGEGKDQTDPRLAKYDVHYQGTYAL